HDPRALRRATGLEAALVDCPAEVVASLDPQDARCHEVRVAGAAALVVAKMHKIAERLGNPNRLVDKDAHDVYRLLVGIPTVALVQSFAALLAHDLSASSTTSALGSLKDLAAVGPHGLVCVMAGRAEEGVGEPDTVAAATSILASDLLWQLGVRD
ncbi:MAG: hypothetical protein WA880_15645, partial [Ornithinimicrobium sp.]